MLIISNLYKSFGEKPLFRDFNLELKDKQSLCIMGSSGCGKTTLLNIIMGLEPYERGSVLKDARKISAVFQEDRLIEGLTAYRNIALVKKNEDCELIKSIASKLELSNFLMQKAGALSGGQKRRLSIARALYYDGELMIFDEAFKGLDKELKGKVLLYVKESTADRQCIFVSHDESENEVFRCKQIVL